MPTFPQPPGNPAELDAWLKKHHPQVHALKAARLAAARTAEVVAEAAVPPDYGKIALLPGDQVIRGAYVGAYGDGQGGSMNVDVYSNFVSSNWDTPSDGSDVSQAVSVTLWLCMGNAHDASKPGTVNVYDYKVLTGWPGDCPGYHVGEGGRKGYFSLQIVNTGKVPVVMDLHRQPA